MANRNKALDCLCADMNRFADEANRPPPTRVLPPDPVAPPTRVVPVDPPPPPTRPPVVDAVPAPHEASPEASLAIIDEWTDTSAHDVSRTRSR
ncbi:MAG: hypothetical protein IT379_18220 [Deltaproteobacteria bacterium]|nr:hypothetical protein [Deltaproteobacteria bacterium]